MSCSKLFPKAKESFLVARLLSALLLLGQLAVPVVAGAATVWNGPSISFSKSASADPTQAANQDRITANVWVTRGSSQGIYNAKTESFFTHFFSPADTEWANGTTANYNSLVYSDWNTWAQANGGPPSTVGVNAVVHLKSEDIYLDLTFTSWASGRSLGGGAFSYMRSTPSTGNNPPSVTITNPINGATFVAPAMVTIQASANDTDGSITNVQFFDGTTSLGNVASSPYNLSVSLAVGSHTVTAVASDNLGATKTSPPVTVTVTGNSPPSAVTILNPILKGGTFSFSFGTQSGYTYNAQFTLDLNPVSWLPLTNFIGDGSVAQVTDSDSTNSRRYYRVEAH